MAYKRKRSTAPAGRRVKRRTGARPMRSLRLASSAGFYVKQKTFLETWQFSSASTAGFWRYYSTNASQMNSYAEHAVVFDEFKIIKVSFEFRPQWDSYGPDNTLWSSGSVHTIIDPGTTIAVSGAFGSSTLNFFLEQGNCKSQRFGTTVLKTFKPKIASQVFGGGLAGRLVSAPWLKTTDISVDHRGVHIYLQQNDPLVLPVKYDVFVTHHIMFRGHR